MNYTNTGLIAEGAPMSKIRALIELKGAINNSNYSGHCKLLLTEEGMEIVDSFLRLKGCDPKLMDLNGKSTYIAKEEQLFDIYLFGVTKGLNWL